MIRAIILAGATSVAVHWVVVGQIVPSEPATLAGGPTQLAMVGNSFETLAAGTVSASATPDPAAVRIPVAPHHADSAEPPARMGPQPVTARAAAAPGAAATSVSATDTVVPVETASASTMAAPATDAERSDEPAPVAATPATRAAAVPATRVETALRPPAEEVIAARAAPMAQDPGPDTPRPQQRIARPAPRQATPPPAPQGNAAETARAGQSSGAAAGDAARTQQGDAGQSARDGRAAAAYPQQVNRHLSRQRRPNTRFDGAALIAFTISDNGGLSRLAVARSSGDPQFDQSALAYIQRAAPFPAPPPGAQRGYQVTVRAR